MLHSSMSPSPGPFPPPGLPLRPQFGRLVSEYAGLAQGVRRAILRIGRYSCASPMGDQTHRRCGWLAILGSIAPVLVGRTSVEAAIAQRLASVDAWSGMQDHLDATIALVPEHLVGVGSLRQR